MIERLRTAVENMRLPAPLDVLRITVSLGISVYPEERITSVYDLIHEADAALYRAKAGGRNRVKTMMDGKA